MATRTWTVGPSETGEVDPDLIAQKMIDVGTLLLTVGGAVNIAPVRVKRPGPLDHDYATIGVVFTWNSFAPAAEIAEPEVDRPGVDDHVSETSKGIERTPVDEPVSEEFNLAEPQPIES